MNELLDALEDTTPTADARRTSRIAAAIYEAWEADNAYGWQKRLVVRTGLSRETIRRHVEDELIRREKIAPTRRYLAEQARRAKKSAETQGGLPPGTED